MPIDFNPIHNAIDCNVINELNEISMIYGLTHRFRNVGDSSPKQYFLISVFAIVNITDAITGPIFRIKNYLNGVNRSAVLRGLKG